MIEPLLQAERLLLHGMLDQAEAIYRRTLDADPRNAIACVGLARVAIERGDDGAAYRQACAALEIDRQNPLALRLEARLAEVLDARGERVERPPWLAGSRAPQQAANTTPDTPAPPAGPAEDAILARNRSMADHQRVEEARQPAAPPSAPKAAPGRAARPARRRRPGLLRRLLGG